MQCMNMQQHRLIYFYHLTKGKFFRLLEKIINFFICYSLALIGENIFNFEIVTIVSIFLLSNFKLLYQLFYFYGGVHVK